MLENIVRHIEAGEKPMDAAFKGSKEVGFTIVSMTLSLVAVFIPVLFMGGVVGRMFNEFGLVISMAILISGIVSLTLTPMLCSRLLQADRPSREAQLPAALLRMELQQADRGLRLGAAPRRWRCRARAADHARHLRDHRVLFQRHPEGLLPVGGHRPDHRLDGRAGRCLVRRHGGAPEACWPRSSSAIPTSSP